MAANEASTSGPVEHCLAARVYAVLARLDAHLLHEGHGISCASSDLGAVDCTRLENMHTALQRLGATNTYELSRYSRPLLSRRSSLGWTFLHYRTGNVNPSLVHSYPACIDASLQIALSQDHKYHLRAGFAPPKAPSCQQLPVELFFSQARRPSQQLSRGRPAVVRLAYEYAAGLQGYNYLGTRPTIPLVRAFTHCLKDAATVAPHHLCRIHLKARAKPTTAKRARLSYLHSFPCFHALPPQITPPLPRAEPPAAQPLFLSLQAGSPPPSHTRAAPKASSPQTKGLQQSCASQVPKEPPITSGAALPPISEHDCVVHQRTSCMGPNS